MPPAAWGVVYNSRLSFGATRRRMVGEIGQRQVLDGADTTSGQCILKASLHDSSELDEHRRQWVKAIFSHSAAIVVSG
jgi:hypothetical protein